MKFVHILVPGLFLFTWLTPMILAAQGQQDKKGKKVEWTRVESTPINKPKTTTNQAGIQIRVGIVARSTDGVLIRRIDLNNREKIIHKLEPGNKVYVGDQFEVGKASAVEIIFGHNARLKIGENSVMRIINKIIDTHGPVINTQRDLELEKGTARVRVKKNIHKPSPIILIAGSMVLTIERSDTVLKRTKDKSEVMVLNGTADLILKDEGNRSWSGGSMIRVKRAEKILIPDKIESKLPTKEKMRPTEIELAIRKLKFSVEEERLKLPPAPAHDKELDKP